MFFRRFQWTFLMILIFGTFLTSAQDDEMQTLRDLADANDFHFGAAVYTNHLGTPGHAETLATEFNMLTPENEAKMCELQPQQGRFDFRRLDELVAFAEENNMTVRGHTLLWHQCMPSWFGNGDFTREEAIQIMHDHIYTVVGRYKGRIKYWDVVNEGISDNSVIRVTPWQRFIGDDYMELAFQFAHEADPDAILFYNDYGAEGMNTKSNRIYEMVSDFVARGVPIHGVGLQGHFTVGDAAQGRWVGPSNLNANINRLGELGLEVQITELDIRHDGPVTDEILERQANDYYNITSTCLENPYCTALITWGVSDRYTWLRNDNLGFFNNPEVAPLLFDDDYEPKLGYFAVMDAFRAGLGLERLLTEVDLPVPTEEPAIVVEIPEPMKSDEAQLAPDSVSGAVYYAAFPIVITLDGEIEDWANIPHVTIDDGPMLLENNDTTMTFAVAADNENLYFLADVKDSTIVYGNYESSEWYREDSVEFYLNTIGDLDATAYEAGIAQIGIMAATIAQPDALMFSGSNSAQSQIIGVVVETDDGYRVEAAVPLDTDVWSIQPAHLGVLGFQVHLNGSSADDRDTKLIWSVYDTTDQSWTNPSLFGQLIFWDINQ